MHGIAGLSRSWSGYLVGMVTGSMALVAGCSGSVDLAGAQPLPAGLPASDAAAKASPATTAEEAVRQQYAAFLAALEPLSRAPALQRPAIIDALATPPARPAIMAAIAQADLAGEVFYGAPVARDPSVLIAGATATVRDCQDTSTNGRKARESGQIRAHGVSHDPVVLTFQLGADGVWRVATVSYPGGSC